MNKTLRNSSVLLTIFLAGCSSSSLNYSDLRKLDVKGQDFNAALSREYKTFALYENDEMSDWEDAAHFKKKAFLVALGQSTEPEQLDKWNVPQKNQSELASARRRLVAALKSGGGGVAPRKAARAQASFDCWIEQQEEGFQPKHIAQCRNEFYQSVKHVEEGVAFASSAPDAFTIFFNFDSADLLPDQSETLDAIVAASKIGKQVKLLVSGHADRAGPKGYNLVLSQLRALQIENALLRQGVPQDLIAVSASGEARPRVTTPDGARHQRNRRVEIVIGDAPSL
jgi:OmpA-OmpF porin, OOP family